MLLAASPGREAQVAALTGAGGGAGGDRTVAACRQRGGDAARRASDSCRGRGGGAGRESSKISAMLEWLCVVLTCFPCLGPYSRWRKPLYRVQIKQLNYLSQ